MPMARSAEVHGKTVRNRCGMFNQRQQQQNVAHSAPPFDARPLMHLVEAGGGGAAQAGRVRRKEEAGQAGRVGRPAPCRVVEGGQKRTEE